MQKIRITEAQHIADRIGAEAVVVIAFGGDNFAVTSYGQTKAKCRTAGQWIDVLCDHIASGALPAPYFGP